MLKDTNKQRVVITGAAGSVGQNLLTLLSQRTDLELIAIDKHTYNMKILQQLHPQVISYTADLAFPGEWQQALAGADLLIQLHAQITGKTTNSFVQNNITSTEQVLSTCQQHHVPYIIHVSSSVVNSIVIDNYSSTKKTQEQMVVAAGIPYCVLRPTLMFGWFDPKHLGWLARFMEKVPVFPIPGNGKFMRQPFYNLDFCRIIEVCLERKPQNITYDLVGTEKINYIDIIRTIKQLKQLKTPLLNIPQWFFAFLLRCYALFSAHPPFTADQLKALTAGDEFKGVDIKAIFNIEPTVFTEAMRATLLDPRYSHIQLQENF